MCRAEIIANRSVEEEITLALENAISSFLFTIIQDVQGKGGADRKLGDVTWPELNFIMIAYIDDSDVAIVRSVIAEVKKHFPNEGIKLFIMKSTE